MLLSISNELPVPHLTNICIIESRIQCRQMSTEPQEAERCTSLGAGSVEVETTNLMDDKAVDDLCAMLLEVCM